MTTTLYRRGRVHTPDNPVATALLVDGDVIAWVGRLRPSATPTCTRRRSGWP